MVHTIRQLRAPLVFLFVVASVYTAAFYIRGILDTVESPEILAAGVVADMVLLVPAAYYFLVVRRFGLPVISVVGVIVLSLIAASQLIPSQQRGVLAPLEIIVVVAELTVMGLVAWKAAAGIRRFRRAAAGYHSEDTLYAIREAARQVIDSKRVADILAYEMAILYYGLAAWRRPPVEGPGRYTSYKRNNYGPTLLGLGALLVVELVAVHVIVQLYWSTAGAWVLTILSAYALVWLLSEWHSHRLRPVMITSDALILRAGIRWEVTIPFDRIASFWRISVLEDTPRGALNLVTFGDACFEVTTDGAVEAHGAYGLRKRVDCVRFAIDTPDDFHEALAERLRKN